jgi:hypothetical protein
MLNRLILLFILSVAIISCKHEAAFTEVKVNNRYAIAVPEYLQPCADLHKDASLQYQNVEKDIYAMVIDEKKATMQNYDLDYDIDLYFKNIASQPFLETIKNGKVSIPGRQQVDGNKALIAEITGSIEQMNENTGHIEQTEVFYKLGVIESPYEFYQILIWTRADEKDKVEQDMMRMIESFKELPHPKEELPQPKLSDSVSIVPAY